MSIETLSVPDLGGANDVEVIEVCIAVGDDLELEQSIVVLETDKATMEVPCTKAGKVTAVHIAEGAKLNEGEALVDIEIAAGDSAESSAEEVVAEPEPVAEEPSAAPVPEAPADAAVESEVDIIVPDLGGAEDVDVIEVCVSAGDEVAEGDSLIVLETDKASMEVPAEHAGTIVSISVSEGGKVNKGQSIGRMKTIATAPAVSAASPEPVAAPAAASPAPEASRSGEAKLAPPPAKIATIEDGPETAFYAGPAVRQLARQLGVELTEVKASGPRGRLSKEDVRNHAKTIIEDVKSGKLSSGAGIPAIPDVDHSQFGPITIEPLSKIAKITAENMSRNWLNVPHVTQFDDADITELEAFRKSMKAEAEKRGSKLTPLPFLIKAVAATLRAEPSFNVSLHSDGENLVRKDYVHIGIAADTPRGLLVPVLRDADKKGLWQIADEVNELIGKARDGKLMPKDMQGACFTISSLGAMGGKGFTPIVNAPQVAIMGVSKASIQPVWDGKEFQPRQMLPLSLSYDHRAINGADCGRFFTHLVATLSDIRRLLL
ncbi:dihydrolipoyllysine-residue acetyltransferase [Pseudoteredinibacter isoporae]|uniref:Acetyltransferase component of pyruvate dehydrogenase complex n=1 Tax=Pseudoteredinibacter isoporae TaxID=570281 RepID=A0A7X0JWY7_9GAMM|nr:dihydrolipoyllysine-residue acetyltransferase [Pseudoteredinibacter isoporae]MBB6522801.1 pyruvate dehydrogenase E2 component (dihydrolipoamide acetyltransferase) [Pseudoteredinibacter isoporae]NHO88328.1 dihydrolipoyllysine-residue acetyltransferase [Pseudoteredinibacter isoporae]NIB23341.1 dihydrolipoyllysine-residue acetyltransferase [Pseudoteredinibacter isoporae]